MVKYKLRKHIYKMKKLKNLLAVAAIVLSSSLFQSCGTDEDYTAFTMGSSSNSSTVIDGFAYALWNMRPHEAGTSIFYSPLGYGSTGSGSKIPGFSPLRFDIYIVDKED